MCDDVRGYLTFTEILWGGKKNLVDVTSTCTALLLHFVQFSHEFSISFLFIKSLTKIQRPKFRNEAVSSQEFNLFCNYD